MLARLPRFFLSALLVFAAITSIVGGTDLMLWPTGLVFNLHPIMLQHSPFSNFLLPGLLSVILVGGSSLVAFFMLSDNRYYALPAALLCGILIIHWAALSALCINSLLWINKAYWVLGFTIVLTALLMRQKRIDAPSK